MAYINGIDRNQPCFSDFFILDNLISEDNPVRAIDAFVSSLDLASLGFIIYDPNKAGQRPYNTSTLLKIHLYGFFNKVTSCRRLQKECSRNIELMWLTGKLVPDYSTISAFFKSNSDSIKKLFKEFNNICIQLDLFGFKIFAVDGTKIKASNSLKNSFTQDKLKLCIENIDKKIQEYSLAISSDLIEDKNSINEFQQKLKLIEQRKIKYSDLLEDMQKNDILERNLVDPDCKVMNNHGRTECDYNIQSVVDSKNHLILNHEVTNNANDIGLLEPMVTKTIQDYNLNHLTSSNTNNTPSSANNLTVIADAGYFKSSDIINLNNINISPIVPKPKASGYVSSAFSKDNFIYNKVDDTYTCPYSKKLYFLRNSKETRKNITSYYKIYACNSCFKCPNLNDCTTSINGRTIKRNINESSINTIQNEYKHTSSIYRLRKSIVEHPFGTIKFTLGFYHTEFRRKPMVSAWASLAFFTYNFKRVIHILGVNKLIKAFGSA